MLHTAIMPKLRSHIKIYLAAQACNYINSCGASATQIDMQSERQVRGKVIIR